MERVVSISVGTNGTEQWMSTFQDLSELAKNLGETHDYVSVSSSLVGEPDDEEDAGCDHEKLRHDAETLAKVRNAITAALREEGSHDYIYQVTDSIITKLQNAGILFRERA